MKHYRAFCPGYKIYRKETVLLTQDNLTIDNLILVIEAKNFGFKIQNVNREILIF